MANFFSFTEEEYSEKRYNEMIGALMGRFKSFQTAGSTAYKPGLERMEFMDSLMGHPHRKYQTVHVAGTNGKGSVSNMLVSLLAASGKKVGLYTSPHISDFRERMRIVTDEAVQLIAPEEVWAWVKQWGETCSHLDLSFFEITTAMAFDWFARRGVDVAVIETGLGGRLDSTNIITPVLSVITNIGLDHCDILGSTLPEIAFEKAGIIKPGVNVVVGESGAEIDGVFERKFRYCNMDGGMAPGYVPQTAARLVFADKVAPRLWDDWKEMMAAMDLQGSYQKKNLRTVLAASELLLLELPDEAVKYAIGHTAARTGFHGRWETLNAPGAAVRIIGDIGHNEHGLKYNFAQLQSMLDSGEISSLTMLYGSVSDKDVAAVVKLFPQGRVQLVFTQAQGLRAMPAERIAELYCETCAAEGCEPLPYMLSGTVIEGLAMARKAAVPAEDNPAPMIYIGGSTYVLSEAIAALEH